MGILKCYVGHEYLHVKVFVPLPITGEKPVLVDIQFGKTKDDEITYF